MGISQFHDTVQFDAPIPLSFEKVFLDYSSKCQYMLYISLQGQHVFQVRLLYGPNTWFCIWNVGLLQEVLST